MKLYKLIIIFILSVACIYAKPFTIPYIQEWEDNDIKYTLNNNTKILIHPQSYSKLIKPVNTFLKDLNEMYGIELNINKGDNPSENDIYFTLEENMQKQYLYGDYEINIREWIKINATSDTGIFYGTRTLLQLFKQNLTINGGVGKDYPDYLERGLGVDNGRHCFTKQWYVDYIKELSYYKMNYFHWHFSDNEGFRIKSDKFPEIASEKSLTKEEVKELIELANEYYIDIIPEIDMPNHMGWLLRNYKEFQILKTDGERLGPCCIDYTLEEARNFLKELIFEFVDLFPSKYFHLGGDEASILADEMPQFTKFAKDSISPDADADDTFIWFHNWLNSLLKSKNKTMRVWNDALNYYKFKNPIIKFDDDIVIEHWEAKETLTDSILTLKNKIMNANSWCLYYTLGDGWKANSKLIYEEWTPEMFFRTYKPEVNKAVTGAKIQIWADDNNNQTELQVSKELRTPLMALATKTWNVSDNSHSYNDFLLLKDTLYPIPGVLPPKALIPNDLALNKKYYSSSNESEEFAAKYAFDGEYNTRWASKIKTDPSWIMVDLDSIYNISTVKISWEYSFAKDFEIQFSKDSLTWNTVRKIKDLERMGNYKYDEINDSARFVRIWCTRRTNENGYSIYEIELYDSLQIKNNYVTVDKNNEIYNFDFLISPNPVNKVFQINYNLGDKQSNVTIELYDLLGRKVNTLISNKVLTGKINCKWNRTNELAGTYFLLIKIDKKTFFKKINLID